MDLCRKIKGTETVFSEIKEIIGIHIEKCPRIALLNKDRNCQIDKRVKELIIFLVTATRLIISRNLKNNKQLSLFFFSFIFKTIG